MQSFPTLRKFGELEEEDFGGIFQRMAEFLEGSGEQGHIQFQILGGTQALYWSIQLEPNRAHARAESIDKPDLEIITNADTARQIAAGTLSPVDAFLHGKLRIRGNIQLARGLLKRLAASEGEFVLFI